MGEKKSLAKVAFILSIVGFITGFMCVGIILDITAIILSIIAINNHEVNKKSSYAAIVIAALGIVLTFGVFTNIALNQNNKNSQLAAVSSEVSNTEKIVSGIKETEKTTETEVGQSTEKTTEQTTEKKEKTTEKNIEKSTEAASDINRTTLAPAAPAETEAGNANAKTTESASAPAASTPAATAPAAAAVVVAGAAATSGNQSSDTTQSADSSSTSVADKQTPAASTVEPASPGADTGSSDQTVYITNTGSKYHTGSCRTLKKSKIEISLAEAKAKGFTPCKLCNPPQ